MPAYRAPRTIRGTLDSILGQTVSDLEVVVVDDGSGDETPDVVAGYAASDPRVRLIEQENAGTAAARNTGVAAAGGEFISLLDNDDAWVSTYLEEVDAAFAAAPDAGMAYADAWAFDSDSGRIYKLTTLEDAPAFDPDATAEEMLLTLLDTNFITASSVTMRRSALDAVGPFHTGKGGSDDWDMWLRITGAGFRAVRAGSTPQVMLREHRSSQSKDELLMRRGALQVISDAVDRLPADSEAGRAARAARERHERSLAQLDTHSPLRRAMTEALRWAIRVRSRMIWRLRWHEPSPEVREAFPRVGEI